LPNIVHASKGTINIIGVGEIEMWMILGLVGFVFGVSAFAFMLHGKRRREE